jgi:DNA-binding LacI/PurR family transcriptional regulator
MKDIKELAKHLGLSVGTVSRALNDRPEVNLETRRRVQEAAREIGYVQNQAGRSLRLGATQIIGFFMHSSEILKGDSAGFFISIINGMQREFARENLDLVVFPGSSDEDSTDYLARLSRRQVVDGVIVAETRIQDPRIEYLERTKIPFITFGQSQTKGNYNWLDFDFEDVVRRLVARFLNTGHRRIAFAVSEEDTNYLKTVLNVLPDVMKSHGLAFSSHMLRRAPVNRTGAADIARWLLEHPDRPTAVMISHAQFAPGIYDALAAQGMKPGVDLAITALLQNVDSQVLEPPLSGFATDMAGLGAHLARMLMARLPAFAARYSHYAENKLWPATFHLGGSDVNGPNL